MDAEFRLPALTNATDLATIHATDQDVDRVCRRVSKDPATGCWLWTGARNPTGYGIVRIGGSTVRVHRATFWWLSTQLLLDGFEVDHLCRVRHCCNPDHLEAVTHEENVRRGRAGINWTARTQCPKGHAYIGDDVYVGKNGNRQCRACQRERMRQRRATARAAGAPRPPRGIQP